MRKFYLVYQKQQTLSVNSNPEIPQTLSAKYEIEKSASLLRKSEGSLNFKQFLSWSHFLQLIKIDNSEERNLHEIEVATTIGLFVNQRDNTIHPFIQWFNTK